MSSNTCGTCAAWSKRKRPCFPRGHWGACHHSSTRRRSWVWAGEKACELWARRPAK